MKEFPKTEAAAKKWWAQYQRLQNIDRCKCCEHGHFDCSIVESGACMDEILSNYPQLGE